MDRLSPLLELRGEWRQAAAITAPAAAAELVEVLDRALDLLDMNRQLDEASLNMAVDVVCRAFQGRPDEVELLRHRLRRGVRDFAVATAGTGIEEGVTSEAFADEEALANALFGLGGAAEEEGEAPVAPVAPAPAPRPVLDEKALRKSLSDKGRRRRRALLRALPLVIVLLAIVAAIVYFITHPPQIVVQQGGPTPSAATGTGTCDYQANISGTVDLTLNWLPSADPMSLDVVDASGKTVASADSRTGGSISLHTPSLPAQTYTVRVVNSSHAAGPVQFQLTLGSSSAPVTGSIQGTQATCPGGTPA